METLLYWCRTIGYAARHAATGHLTESTLIALALAGDKSALSVPVRRSLDVARDHVSGCEQCETDLFEIKITLKNIQQGAQRTSSAIAELVPHELTQRAEILRRIDTYLAPPATLLRFPSIGRRSLVQLTPATVCLVLTFAAGPLLSVILRPSVTSSQDSLVEVSTSSQDDFLDDERSTQLIESTFGPYDLTAAEALMAEVEYAVGAPGVSHLSVLDALTPRLHDGSVTVR